MTNRSTVPLSYVVLLDKTTILIQMEDN